MRSPQIPKTHLVRFALAFAILLGTLLGSAPTASAETWLCPDCDATVERAPGAATLDCAPCGVSFTEDDLTWYVSYANHRTRDVELSFLILPEDCQLFRPDGLRAFGPNGNVWIPWVMVDYFIPRMRLVRLVDDREFATDYPKGSSCPAPPSFLFEYSDTIDLPGAEPTVSTTEVEADLASLFVLARSEEALERGVTRFIHDVEAGLHPRLPRTKARVLRALAPSIPAGVPAEKVHDKKVVVHVRVADRGGVQQISVPVSSGYEALDAACISRARSAGVQGGGELGVPVPATVEFIYTFANGTPAVEVVFPDNSIWGDRGKKAETEGK